MVTEVEFMAGFNRGRKTPKEVGYSWEPIQAPGMFQWIHKSKIGVDHIYQRDNVSQSRVLWIARYFSWPAFGTLTIGIRPDGSMWATDGQHRKLAADKRSDVQEVPCLVYPMSHLRDEALAFLTGNCFRGPVQMVDKFRALISAEDPTAIGVRNLVETTGHVIGAAKNGVKCVGRLISYYKQNREILTQIWPLIASVSNGDPICDDTVAAVYWLERHLRKTEQGSLLDAHNRQALVAAGSKHIRRKIAEAKAYKGGGEKSAAEGLANVLNFRRSSRRIEL